MKTAMAWVCGILAFLAIFGAVSAGMGWAASWVLSAFGVHVAWYVCSVGIFLLGAIFGRGGK